MTTLDEREREFEARFSHDQELAFKVRSRRDKLFGLWAARQLGLSGEAAEAYARDVVAAEFGAPRGRGVLAKVSADFAAKGVGIDEARIADELQRLGEEARRQVERE
ncbi:MAG TPA: DUF1476 domain-containing protein [Stellaceae bacterium]|nr:DUF1476 domain-containing protein [Stellaceae bacterium]